MPDSDKQVLEAESAEVHEAPPESENAAEAASGSEGAAGTPAPGDAGGGGVNGAAAPAKQEGPSGEHPEEHRAVAQYDIIPSQRVEPESNFAAEHYRPIAEALAAQGQNGKGKKPKPILSEASIERIGKFASSQTRVYAIIGVGMGLLVGLIVAVTFLRPGTASAPNDMGAVNSIEYGVKGQLTTHWSTKLEYRLKIEPLGPGQRVAFLSTVNSSPKPLSMTLQMKDPFGAVLCSNTILLKFDPRNIPSNVIVNAGPNASRADQARAARNQIQQSIDLARLEGDELDRERGKDMFQEDSGPDGQLASISSVGTLPCTQKQYERIAAWGFKTDFPIVAQPVVDESSAPNARAKSESTRAGEAQNRRDSAERAQVDARTRRRLALPVPPVSIEGDDAIVWVDALNGIVETSAGKALLLDKSDPVVNDLKGRDIPIAIHYRCDETGACTFAAIGTGVHRARLRR